MVPRGTQVEKKRISETFPTPCPCRRGHPKITLFGLKCINFRSKGLFGDSVEVFLAFFQAPFLEGKKHENVWLLKGPPSLNYCKYHQKLSCSCFHKNRFRGGFWEAFGVNFGTIFGALGLHMASFGLPGAFLWIFRALHKLVKTKRGSKT